MSDDVRPPDATADRGSPAGDTDDPGPLDRAKGAARGVLPDSPVAAGVLGAGVAVSTAAVGAVSGAGLAGAAALSAGAADAADLIERGDLGGVSVRGIGAGLGGMAAAGLGPAVFVPAVGAAAAGAGTAAAVGAGYGAAAALDRGSDAVRDAVAGWRDPPAPDRPLLTDGKVGPSPDPDAGVGAATESVDRERTGAEVGGATDSVVDRVETGLSGADGGAVDEPEREPTGGDRDP